MNRLTKYNQIILAVLLTGGLLFTIGLIVTLSVSPLFRGAQGRGIQVEPDNTNNDDLTVKSRIVTVSEPYFYSKVDQKFLVAEVEVQRSPGGSDFYISKGRSWSGGTVLNFYSTIEFLIGCDSCWFRNIIFFENGDSEGQKLYTNKVLITRFYIPNPESKALGSDSSYTKSKRKALSNFALYSVIEEDTNKDGLLNKLDEEITYISDLSFNKKTRVTPAATQLLEWKFDLQGENLFLYVKQDTNGNNEFDKLDKRSILMTSIQSPSLARAIIGPMKGVPPK